MQKSKTLPEKKLSLFKFSNGPKTHKIYVNSTLVLRLKILCQLSFRLKIYGILTLTLTLNTSRKSFNSASVYCTSVTLKSRTPHENIYSYFFKTYLLHDIMS